MALYRSKETIIADILESCTGGACKTRIVYRANMNSTVVIPYLDKLIDMGLLQITSGDQLTYKTTERGRELLGCLKNIKEEIPQL